MRIKDTNKQNFIWKKINSLIDNPHRKRKIALSLLGTILISTIILISIYCGMVLHKIGLSHIFNEVVHSKPSISILISNYFRGLTANPEHITIDIRHLDYQKLAYKREIALANGILLTDPEDYVPATIHCKNKTVRAWIRLKGDWVDALVGNKWSFRIKIRGEDTLFGMKRFSIHHPKERNYIYEWIVHQALKKEGVISLRYKFVRVTLNGKDLGIYALEEHFDKRLIENNHRRQGPIIKFNEDILWANISAFQDTEEMPTDEQLQLSADIDAFKMNTILRTPQLYNQFIVAKDLLESFRRGALPAHKVFDIKMLAKYFAVSDLTAGLHGFGRWHNLRFYYNPITSLLEPIGFDVMAERELNQFQQILAARALEESADTFHARLFSDIIFFEEYMKELEEVSQRPYLDSLFTDIDAELQENLKIIYNEWPYFVLSKDVFYHNQKYIQTLLNPPKAMHAYFRNFSKNQIELTLGNIQLFPIKVLGVSYKDSFFSVTEKTILAPMVPSKLVNYQAVNFSFPKNFAWSDAMIADLKVKYKLLGTRQIKYERVFAYLNLSDSFLKSDFIRQSPNVHNFKFLSIDRSARKIFIKSGHWDLEKNLIIPEGYTVVCPEGVELNISNSAKILSFSPFEFVGSEDNPIVISSKDSTGQGIVVMNSEQDSIFKYVIFKNLSNPSQGGWKLTGAITFYESDAQISYCQFLNNNAEDSLNIVRSGFLVDRSLFNKVSYDAIDVDFGKGKIVNSSFIDCANDAIDVSGSFVEIHKIFVKGSGDKGLSVGENSCMDASEIEIRDAKIAVASKDMSRLSIEDINLSDCEVGCSVYKKKPEFGPASMYVNKLKMTNIKIPYLVEKGSTLVVEGTLIEPEQKDAK